MGHKKGTKFKGIPRNPQHPLPDSLVGNLRPKGYVRPKKEGKKQ